MRISVDGLPFIREMTTPRKLLAGSQLEWLYCPYGGFPIDKITWDKDGKSTILYHCNGVKIILKFFASNDFTNYLVNISSVVNQQSFFLYLAQTLKRDFIKFLTQL